MSISPPSDIVLDVAQAADPLRLQAATARLAKIATGGDNGFAALLGPVGSGGQTLGTAPVAPPSFSGSPARTTTAMSPYQKFEALMLQNFVQNILPKDQELFGDAASADLSRSMLAEQVANQIAKSGRIGIAHLIEHAHGSLGRSPAAAPPSADPGPAASAAAVEAASVATGPGIAALATLASTRLNQE